MITQHPSKYTRSVLRGRHCCMVNILTVGIDDLRAGSSNTDLSSPEALRKQIRGNRYVRAKRATARFEIRRIKLGEKLGSYIDDIEVLHCLIDRVFVPPDYAFKNVGSVGRLAKVSLDFESEVRLLKYAYIQAGIRVIGIEPVSHRNMGWYSLHQFFHDSDPVAFAQTHIGYKWSREVAPG